MASVLQTAVGSHFGSLKRSAGVAITYDRDGDSVAITAVPGRIDYDRWGDSIEDIGGEAADWLILASDLVLATAGLVLPQRSDVITNAAGDTFEVVPRTEGRVFDYMDQYRVALRVFCVETS